MPLNPIDSQHQIGFPLQSFPHSALRASPSDDTIDTSEETPACIALCNAIWNFLKEHIFCCFFDTPSSYSIDDTTEIVDISIEETTSPIIPLEEFIQGSYSQNNFIERVDPESFKIGENASAYTSAMACRYFLKEALDTTEQIDRTIAHGITTYLLEKGLINIHALFSRQEYANLNPPLFKQRLENQIREVDRDTPDRLNILLDEVRWEDIENGMHEFNLHDARDIARVEEMEGLEKDLEQGEERQNYLDALNALSNYMQGQRRIAALLTRGSKSYAILLQRGVQDRIIRASFFDPYGNPDNEIPGAYIQKNRGRDSVERLAEHLSAIMPYEENADNLISFIPLQIRE